MMMMIPSNASVADLLSHCHAPAAPHRIEGRYYNLVALQSGGVRVPTL
jgi:hypothetical protein